MPFSHHSHSGQFCRHAHGSLASVVDAAVARGFSTYGLSEHVPRSRKQDLYPEEEDLSPDDLWTTFDAYVAEASRLKRERKDEIALLVGLETELIEPSTSLLDLEKVLARHGREIDFVVGSVHHVAGTPIDFDRPTFDRALRAVSRQGQREGDPLRLLFRDYLDAQFELIDRFRPEVVGHFDLCRLYHPHERLDRDEEVWQRVVRNVRRAVEYGALFEVNTAALRRGWPTPYPGPEVLGLIVAEGGRLTLSDDSHNPDGVGSHYDQAYGYLREHGVRELWYLEKSPSSGERAVARKWTGHSPWHAIIPAD